MRTCAAERHRSIGPVFTSRLSRCDTTLFDQQWKEKWRLIDESFSIVSAPLTKGNGKAIGATIVVYVNAKFPSGADSEFTKI